MITPEDKAAAEAYCAEQDGIGDDGKQIPCTVDARTWTKEWLRTIERHPDIPKCEGTMIGWFANAIMAGHDEAQRRNKVLVTELEGKIARAKDHLESSKIHGLLRGNLGFIDAALKELK